MIVACEERDGTKLRRVTPMLKDPKLLKELAEKITSVPSFLDGATWEVMLDEDFLGVLVDNVGVIVLDAMMRGHSARCHVTFWDKRLRGRELLCRRVADMWMDRYCLNFLHTAIPVGSKTVLAFCKRVGFEALPAEGGYVPMVLRRYHYLHRANSQQGGT